jgi:hypothetical protein
MRPPLVHYYRRDHHDHSSRQKEHVQGNTVGEQGSRARCSPLDGTTARESSKSRRAVRARGVQRIAESNAAIHEIANELLERVIVQMVGNADNLAPTPAHVFNANQNVRVCPAKRVREAEDVFEKLRLVIVRRLREGIPP